MKWNILSTTVVLAAALSLATPGEARTRRSRYKDAQKMEQNDSGIGKGPGYGKEENEMNMGYASPARVDCQGGWDMFLSGSFIYWFTGQQQMDVASFQTSDAVAIVGTVEQDQKYKPGFKVALGTTFGHDDWMGKVEYTRLHLKTKTTTTPPTSPGDGQLHVNIGWVDEDLDFVLLNQLKTRWKNKLDIIDAELGRWAYSGRMLTVNTFFGARGGWLKQDMRVSVYRLDSPTVPLVQNLRSSSWFMGPRAGLDTNWILGWGFRVTGDFAANLLYQRQKVRVSYTNSTTNVVNQIVKGKHRPVSPVAELGLGLGWGSYFMDNSWHFDLHAAYEFQYWFNQNAMRPTGYSNVFSNPQVAAPIKAGDEYYHGLTLTARFDF